MKTGEPRAAESPVPPESAPAGRLRDRFDGSVGDVLAVVGLVAVAVSVEIFLGRLLTRPFYYDEAWRAYDISEGGRFLSHLGTAAAPLSLGWIGIENAARVVFGDTETGLRAPMFAALPVLGVATYLLARRWLARLMSFGTAALLLVNLWIVTYALQLKSYSYEALIAVATLALFLVIQRTTWRGARLLGLYSALGLTCVLSLPNLFVLVPLLGLDLLRAFQRRAVTRVAGEAVAAAIALAHYEFFLRPQGRVAKTGVFGTNFPSHGFFAFFRFAFDGLGSYAAMLITGVVGATGRSPSAALWPAAHGLLTAAVVVLLAAGTIAAARDAAGRALLTATGGALLLELVGSTLRQWPFGLVRVNIFVLPLLYILAGMGAGWLARGLAGLVRSGRAHLASARIRVSWRVAGSTATLALFAGALLAGGVATVQGFAESSTLQHSRTIFDRVKAAVADARATAAPGDLVVIDTDRAPTGWYASPWLYYMNGYQGWPARITALPKVPAQNTLSVFAVTPESVARFLAAHRGSPAIYLLEYNLPGTRSRFSQSMHRQSLTTLRKFGYCPVSDVRYQLTGHLTVLRARCPLAG